METSYDSSYMRLLLQYYQSIVISNFSFVVIVFYIHELIEINFFSSNLVAIIHFLRCIRTLVIYIL